MASSNSTKARKVEPVEEPQPVEEPYTEPVSNNRADRSPDYGRYWLAALLILAGLIILLNNLQILPWGLWFYVSQYWPVLLIFFGLDLILRKNPLARLVSFIVGLLVLIAIVGLSAAYAQPSMYEGLRQQMPWLPMMGQEDQFGEQQFERTIEAEEFSGVNSRQVNADFGIGKVNITDEDRDFYLDVKARYFLTGFRPEVATNEENDELTIDVSTTNNQNGGFHMNWGRFNNEYNLILGRPSLPTSLEMEMGVGEGILNLNDVLVRNLRLETGVGKIAAEVGQKSIPTQGIELEAGTGSIELTLPENVGLKVNYEVGVGSLRIDGQDIERGGEVYETDNYDSADKKLEMTVKVGVGSITIDRK